MKNIAIIAALAASVLAVPAIAADGSLSSSNSSSSMTVTTTIPKLVKISGLSDLSFSPTAADLSNVNGTQNATKQFCVYSNDTADGLYKIKVDGTAGSELNTGELKFGLNGPNSQVLDMGVWASDQANNAYAAGTMAPGVERSNFKTTSGGQARPTTLNCNGGTNASLAFKLKNSGILKVTAGSYTSVLTVTVSTL
ncbi:MAG TPA: hypothetical protein VF503_32590 [Sphingobium sp.]|uniref:hypothetical protein n=1 Tax=Sphingobium sp. TaxID=1912891 RepID=UPI002ED35DFD